MSDLDQEGQGGGGAENEEMDREEPSDQPADVGGWEDNEPSTHAGEGGQSEDVA